MGGKSDWLAASAVDDLDEEERAESAEGDDKLASRLEVDIDSEVDGDVGEDVEPDPDPEPDSEPQEIFFKVLAPNPATRFLSSNLQKVSINSVLVCPASSPSGSSFPL